MKIITVTMVKNEENILESFVRYAMIFSDQVVVFNHNSTDGTLQILESLENEYGKRMIIFPEIADAVMTINREMFNKMIRYAFDELEADIVLPLDSDEFPVLPGKGNLRSYLEGLSQEKCYKVHFMPFSLSDEWKKEVFVPLLFKRRKKINIDTDSKIILTRKTYYQYGLEVGLGNHKIDLTATGQEVPLQDLFPELLYAHFPFRNREHLEGKLVLRWLALMMRDDVGVGTAFQYQKGYLKILEGKNLLQEEIDWFCLNNMCMGIENAETAESIQKMVEETDNSELFENIELKYTEYAQEKSNYVLLMEFTQQVIDQYKNQKNMEEQLRQKNAELEKALEEKQKECQNVNKILKEKQEECQTVNKMLEEKQKECQNVNRMLEEKQEECQNVNRMLEKKQEECQNVNRMLEEKQKECQNVNEMLEDTSKTLQDTSKALQDTSTALQEASETLQGIRRSKAWKLIQTYRKIVGKHDPTQD